MKRISVLLVLSVILLSVASAQSTEEKEVASAIESLRKAMVDADKSALENLVAAELSYGHSSGTMEDKTTFVEVITSGKNDYKTFEISGQTIRIVGNIAIVRHKMMAEISNNGAATIANLGVLQIWQMQQGTWKLLARQAYKL
ncbi:MAG: nuclear transport factor 2 family protein [Bacteroidota bacterium]